MFFCEILYLKDGYAQTGVPLDISLDSGHVIVSVVVLRMIIFCSGMLVVSIHDFSAYSPHDMFGVSLPFPLINRFSFCWKFAFLILSMDLKNGI